MPMMEFKARIPSFRLRPPNVRPDEGGPRLTIVLDADCDQEDLDLNALRERVTTQDKKEVKILISWTNDDEKLKQAPMSGMVHCGPGRRKGTWQCTDLPGEHLLSPCKHQRDKENRAAEATTAEPNAEKADETDPQPPAPNDTPRAKDQLIFCYSPEHPTAAHLKTSHCIDAYKPEPNSEYEIYTGDADDAAHQHPTPMLVFPSCFYSTDTGDWTCRAFPDANTTEPCQHITTAQREWAKAAGWTPTNTNNREAWIEREAAKVTAELDRTEAADRELEQQRGPAPIRRRTTHATTPA